MNARSIQAIALATAVGSATIGGTILPRLMAQSDERGLRYTTESVEGAPPWVAIGTAIGALRGLVVDILWLKDESLEDTENLPAHAILAAEIVASLEAALDEFRGVEDALQGD